MAEHQAIWFDADGYILNEQFGNNVIYEIVSIENNIINMEDILIPTNQTNLPEGWPIYELRDSIASVAVNPVKK